MKPNPCKCDNCERLRIAYDTWQKNNPLSPKKQVSTNAENHQFKVGDWVRVINNQCAQDRTKIGSKQMVTDVVTSTQVKLQDGYLWEIDQLEPTTRLKRKEIRERLRYIMDYSKDLPMQGNIVGDLEQLIEEI